MPRKRPLEVIFRMRSEVRGNYEACDLEGVERYNFEMLLNEVMKLLRQSQGLPPDAIADEREANRFTVSNSVLQATYDREVVPIAGSKNVRIVITFVGLICARPGRPSIEM